MKRYLIAPALLPLLQAANCSAPIDKDSELGNDEPVGQTSQAVETPWFSFGPSGFNVNFAVNGDPTNYTGRILDYEFSTGLVATSRGGLWKTGNPAVPLTDGKIPTLVMNSVVSQPGNTNRIIVGTGEAVYQVGAGIWYSTNAGSTWTQATLSTGGAMTDAVTGNVDRIKFNPTTTTTVHAVAGRGYFRSLNSGQTWSNIVIHNSGENVSDLAINPQNPSILYAAIWGDGIYKTTQGGNAGSWSKLVDANGVLPTANLGRISLAIAPSSPTTLYTLVGNSNGFFFDVYKSTNSGSAWTKTNLNPSDGQSWYNNTLAVHPTNSSIVLAGAIKLYRYNGTSWTTLDDINHLTNFAAIHDDQHVVSWGGSGNVIVGNDGGLSSSTDDGVNWTPNSQKLAITQFYDMDLGRDAPTGDVMIAGTQDVGLVVTTNAGQTWTGTLDGDVPSVSVDPTNSFTMFATERSNKIRYQSHDQGFHWSEFETGLPCTNTVDSVIRSQQLPPSHFYTNNNCSAQNAVYERTNTGNKVWRQLGTGFSVKIVNIEVPKLQPFATSNILVYAILEGGEDQVWGFDSRFQMWFNFGLPNAFQVDSVISDPNTPDTIYAIMIGSTPGQKLWRSRNRGSTWVNISGTLPNDGPMLRETHQSLAIHPASDNTLYVALRSGVYITRNANDASPSWTLFSEGMPTPLQVSALRGIDRRAIDGTFWLMASTYGRSIWERGPL